MAFNGDKTWEDLVLDISPIAERLLRSIREGKGQYDEWQSFRNARTNADIASVLGRSEPDVAEMDAAFAAFDSIMRYLDNDTPPGGLNQGFALRVLS